MNNQNQINEIRSKIDIVELISEYVPLSKKGKYFWGKCPFHNDNNPNARNVSFIVLFVVLACFLFGYYVFSTANPKEPLEIYTSINGR